MPYTILVTPTATDDITTALEYYNAVSADLGYRFADIVADYFDRIANWPTASPIRYKNIRGKAMKRFPYLITYTIDEAADSVNILRVFNTHQKPIH
jgi:plasmid stabilization system protein ParE